MSESHVKISRTIIRGTSPSTVRLEVRHFHIFHLIYACIFKLSFRLADFLNEVKKLEVLIPRVWQFVVFVILDTGIFNQRK